MPKQIGWSNESNLLYTISSQISRLAGVIAASGGGGGTITGGGASGQVTFWNGATSITGSNNLFWDAATGRLGIGTNAPSHPLNILSANAALGFRLEHATSSSASFPFQITNSADTNYVRANVSIIEFLRNGGASTIRTTGSNNDLLLQSSRNLQLAINAGTIAAQLYSTGNLVLQNGGTFTDDNINRLQVSGNAKITGETTITSAGSANGILKINSASRTNGLQFNWFDAGNVGEIWYYSETRFRLNSTGLNLTLTSAGNVVLGGNIDTGERLRVNGDVGITGVLRETVTTNRQTVSYTLALTDRGKLVETNVGAANTITVPPNSSIAFPIGTKIDIAQYGAGQTTIVPGIGVTVRSAGGALKLSAQYSGATIVKIGTDEWYLFGDITV